MSTRTIIEINHDCLDEMRKHPEDMDWLLGILASSSLNASLNAGLTPHPINGVRVLAQRHHSDTLKLEVK